jgi:hypothetical protein
MPEGARRPRAAIVSGQGGRCSVTMATPGNAEPIGKNGTRISGHDAHSGLIFTPGQLPGTVILCGRQPRRLSSFARGMP